MNVVVEDVDPAAERDGLSRESLQTDAELKLRQSGIRILSDAEVLKERGQPSLYLHVQVMKSSTKSLYVFRVDLNLVENTVLERDREITVLGATTWALPGTLGIAGTEQLDYVRTAAQDMVDRFCNAYLTANPKK